MQYETKRQKITKYLKSAFASLKANEKESANKKALVSVCSLDLGISENSILEILQTFENAGIIEIKENDILI
jgi:Ca2+-binding EF-hand superfamily protein